MKTIFQIIFPVSALGYACFSTLFHANDLIGAEHLSISQIRPELYLLIGIIFAIVPILTIIGYFLLKRGKLI